ncbi:right-handed parallel beta-helix repeat-containing protein [Mixta intestinalis]|uniref:Pectate disaccharide-lyase n=1 Tax=Mixta intestinalis TaxID=1615494 RepID=A0A6P1Q019_9GAMM|nr:right-handed parallel beta-helix repeat-containing protein [Mixta intestinalis]QHM71761.1 Pectate disaccharide-lyase [Mixta intestinalis]
MKTLPLVLLLSGASGAYAAETLPSVDSLTWHTITFGQSTDKNFATNVLPEKVGVNQVTFGNAKKAAAQPEKLNFPATIESRGGKIGNSHDGLTFWYTRLPTSANMVLEAEVNIEQFGPENEAKPAGQEGAGLLVRDILGKPRQEEIKVGYEEFPAASNMVMNAIMTQDKATHHRVQATLIARNGVTQSWGNTGVEIKRLPYQRDIDLRKSSHFRLRLARTDSGFTAAWAPAGSDRWVTQQVNDPDRIKVLDSEGYYVGFFAARNARMTVHQARLTLSPHTAAPAEKFVSKPRPANVEIASAAVSASPDYLFQLRSDRDGKLMVNSDGIERAGGMALEAGKMIGVPVPLKAEKTPIYYTLTLANGEKITGTLNVTRKTVADANNLYASPQGSAQNDGSQAHPLDVASAAELLAPGGVLWLEEGVYPYTTLTTASSGTDDQRKKMRPLGGKAVFHGLKLAASYWDIENIEVTKKSFSISGSYNLIQRVTAYQADDTGIWVSSPAGLGRALWASHNVIANAESWGNKDPGLINADGFAVKMRVGEGNKLVNCFSHDNVDDGYDLFNKIEDGPNGVVTIENSVALRNVNNGFKLGGEGIPVAHRVIDSVAIENGMDGFTDNFNPGALWVNNNIAIDNHRFNFIFRPGPYTQPDNQGTFSGNISLRSKPAQYVDAVVGNIDASNRFQLSEKR